MWALVKGERKPPELAGKENRKGEIKDAARMRARVPVYIELEIAYRGIAEAACVVWDAESKKDEDLRETVIVELNRNVELERKI